MLTFLPGELKKGSFIPAVSIRGCAPPTCLAIYFRSFQLFVAELKPGRCNTGEMLPLR
jgi:hypothetical protein